MSKKELLNKPIYLKGHCLERIVERLGLKDEKNSLKFFTGSLSSLFYCDNVSKNTFQLWNKDLGIVFKIYVYPNRLLFCSTLREEDCRFVTIREEKFRYEVDLSANNIFYKGKLFNSDNPAGSQVKKNT